MVCETVYIPAFEIGLKELLKTETRKIGILQTGLIFLSKASKNFSKTKSLFAIIEQFFFQIFYWYEKLSIL